MKQVTTQNAGDELYKRIRKLPVQAIAVFFDMIDIVKQVHSGKKRKPNDADAIRLFWIAKLASEIEDPGDKLSIVEAWVVRRVIEATHGNVSEAARRLGIERKAMERRLVLYGIERPGTRRRAA